MPERAGVTEMATAVQGAQVGHVVTEWWIATNFFRHGGKAVLGPFKTQELAFQVRDLIEQVNKPTTYAIDSSRGRCNG